MQTNTYALLLTFIFSTAALSKEEPRREEGDISISYQVLGLNAYGLVGFMGGYQLDPHNQIEIGIGGGIVSTSIVIAHRYYFLPEKLIAPYVNLGISAVSPGNQADYWVFGGVGFELANHGGFIWDSSVEYSCNTSGSNDQSDRCWAGLNFLRFGWRF